MVTRESFIRLSVVVFVIFHMLATIPEPHLP